MKYKLGEGTGTSMGSDGSFVYVNIIAKGRFGDDNTKKGHRLRLYFRTDKDDSLAIAETGARMLAQEVVDELNRGAAK